MNLCCHSNFFLSYDQRKKIYFLKKNIIKSNLPKAATENQIHLRYFQIKSRLSGNLSKGFIEKTFKLNILNKFQTTELIEIFV